MAFISQNQDGFQMTSSSYDNGRIFCSFTRSIVAENMDEDRNLTESVYLFLAAGNTRGKCICAQKWRGTGMLGYHFTC